MTLLITGGAGFIGSHVVAHFVEKYPHIRVINFDKLTYAANLDYLRAVAGKENYTFVQGDITEAYQVEAIFQTYQIDRVIHLAAESHVDRSISGPDDFIQTNIVGTLNLLNAARKLWSTPSTINRFHHVSTDEVYGSLGEEGYFTESTPYAPRSPYSASKASSDLLVKAYFHTYGLPIVISNCSNNYGPHQHSEKLIPMTIQKMVRQEPVPIYGKGENVRDWLFVKDHVEAIDQILHKGRLGETYNVGGDNEWRNIDLVRFLAQKIDERLGRSAGTSAELITFVKDRAGHDLRYAIDSSKLQKELGWFPLVPFEKGIEETLAWVLQDEAANV